jgi:tripartite-type tricarboxylate transporter receptor subunit TctC
MKNHARTCFIAALAACPLLAHGQNYPVRTVRILVGFSAGGGTDISARGAAQKMTEFLGQPVIVENRPGSGGMIATEAVAKSAPDGYTLLMAAPADTVQPALRAKLPYDFERDLTPVSLVVTAPFALVVHPSVPARNVKELIELARAKPGQLNYASSGIGSSAHMSNEMFNSMAKVNIVHVPFKGTSEGIISVAGGTIDMVFSSFPPVLPLAEAKKVKVLAVSTLKRSALRPDLPTISESGLPGYERYGWYGVMAPSAVPKDVIARLNAAVVKAVATPELRESLSSQGLEPFSNTPEQFAAFLNRELAQNGAIIRATNARTN